MISIIVPVFNAEKSIARCVTSVLNQTYTDFELILIDDGSTDSSLRICRHFAKTDNRIVLFHQDNAGVSAARNLGIAAAKGQFISFIDSDDYIEKDLYEKLNSACTKETDWVVAGFVHEFNNKLSERFATRDMIFHLTPEDSQNCLELFHKRLIFGPCSKLYRAEIIQKHNLSFALGVSYGEDRLFNYNYLEFVSTIHTLSTTGYHYVFQPTSLSSTKYRNQFELDYNPWKRAYKLFESRNLLSSKSKSYFITELYWMVNDAIFQDDNIKPASLYHSFLRIRKILTIDEIDLLHSISHEIKQNWLIKSCILHRNALMLSLISSLLNLKR